MLSDEDRALLDLEARRYRHGGQKINAIQTELGLSAIRYYQRLNLLIDTHEAVAYSPQVVNRLRRLRAQRSRISAA